jgi:hypothetical protein
MFYRTESMSAFADIGGNWTTGQCVLLQVGKGQYLKGFSFDDKE